MAKDGFQDSNHEHLRYRPIKMKKKEEILIEGVNLVGDKIVLVVDGDVVYEVPKKQWHEADMSYKSTPDADVPNSLEEWCDGRSD